jgi:hypothetical protein
VNTKTSQEIPKLRIKETDASFYTGMSRIWLRTQRMKGSGPAYLKIGRAVLYDIRDLDTWLESKKVG